MAHQPVSRPAPISSPAGLRFIALLEATKGALVLLAGFGLFELVHRNIQDMAETLVQHFHLNPASRYPRIFIDTAGQLNDGNLWWLAGVAFAYALVRLVEAYGLWHRQRWAEWLGAVSGGIYVPVELYELLHGVSWPKVLVLAVNAVCVVYLVQALRGRDAARSH